MEFDWPDQKSFIQRHLLQQKRFLQNPVLIGKTLILIEQNFFNIFILLKYFRNFCLFKKLLKLIAWLGIYRIPKDM